MGVRYTSRVPRILPSSFYARECLEVAVALLGKLLVHGPVTLRITEVEAYRFPGDTANHCRFGKTARNAPMWGPPGHAYVYLCYGMHSLLNLVTDSAERGAAVLIRACEPVAGLSQIEARRGRAGGGPELLTGPGKVAAALGLDVGFTGQPLTRRAGLHLLDQPPLTQILVGPRVGVDYAEPHHRDAPWRVAMPDTRWVSKRATLRPWPGEPASFLERERLAAQLTAGSSTPPASEAVGG
jgi:DNA-3-methyladenine glycosylase